MGQRSEVLDVDKPLSLRDLTLASGCTPRTVRYYERQGLLRATRSPGGHRIFASAELERLDFIISLREAGWSLEDIHALLDLREAAADDHVGIERLSHLIDEHVVRLGRKITLLEALRADLVATRELLSTCQACTDGEAEVPCASCERVPRLSALPRAFRLTWRARELGRSAFDERAAACVGEDADE